MAGGQVGGGMAGDVGVAYVDARVISAQEALTKLNSLRSDEPPAVYEPLHARCPVYAAPVAVEMAALQAVAVLAAPHDSRVQVSLSLSLSLSLARARARASLILICMCIAYTRTHARTHTHTHTHT